MYLKDMTPSWQTSHVPEHIHFHRPRTCQPVFLDLFLASSHRLSSSANADCQRTFVSDAPNYSLLSSHLNRLTRRKANISAYTHSSGSSLTTTYTIYHIQSPSSMGHHNVTVSGLSLTFRNIGLAVIPGLPGLSQTESSFASLVWVVAGGPS